MSRFLNEAMIDMRSGRETWRVFLTLGVPSFAVAVVFTLLRIV